MASAIRIIRNIAGKADVIDLSNSALLRETFIRDLKERVKKRIRESFPSPEQGGRITTVRDEYLARAATRNAKAAIIEKQWEELQTEAELDQIDTLQKEIAIWDEKND